LVLSPSGATRIQPFIGRPVLSNSRACRAAQGVVGRVGADTKHQLSTTGDADRHVALQQEPQPAEHRLLGDRVLIGELLVDAAGGVLVVGHPSRERTDHSAQTQTAADLRRPPGGRPLLALVSDQSAASRRVIV